MTLCANSLARSDADSATAGGPVKKDERVIQRSLSFNTWNSREPVATEQDSKPPSRRASGKLNFPRISSQSDMHQPTDIPKLTIVLPEPLLVKPAHPSPLDVAATKLQKVYKSYRTRRNLADCAVVAEELWWKALDFAALNRSSISFFNIRKPETAVSRWARTLTRLAKVGKGLLKDEKAQKLALQHWLEAIDPRHRYGHNLHLYYDSWSDSRSTQPFFYWLDVGDGKEVDVKKCPRSLLQRQCIKYLGRKEREAYEIMFVDGKLVYRQAGMLLNTTHRSKWIFVLSTSRVLYVGEKKKGSFQHSSFLSGAAITAAGRVVATGGTLEAIWPYSGHYLPTEENFQEFIAFLGDNHVDLTDVKKCSIDDDSSMEPAAEEPGDVSGQKAASYRRENKNVVAVRAEYDAPFFGPSSRLKCQWSSGVGPRIGCVRDYPIELQTKALEQVNLSPRLTPRTAAAAAAACRIPIPSPRPSPEIRVSPRLAYMGMPSPSGLVTRTCPH